MIFSNKNGAITPFLLPYREGIEMKRLNELEEIIGYSFKNKALLELAMTHSSYSNDNKLGKLNNNERLERKYYYGIRKVTGHYCRGIKH